MSEQERRTARRLIMKVPLRFRPMQETADPEHEAASMNICNHGVYFATDDSGPPKDATGIGGRRCGGVVLHGPCGARRIVGAQGQQVGRGRAIPLL